MAVRRRKPTTTPPTQSSPVARRSGSHDTTPSQPLWREAGRRAVLGLAGSVGAAAVAVLNWWITHH
ncbi:hypothetical protein [Streptomyces sp. NPDC054794]